MLPPSLPNCPYTLYHNQGGRYLAELMLVHFFVQVKVCITKTSISLTSKKMPEPSHPGPMKRSVVNADQPIKDQPVSPTSFQFL